jgi:hypothetical protein
MRPVLLGVCVLLSVLPGRLVAQGKLESVREEVNRSDDSDEGSDRKSHRKNHRDSCTCDDDDDGFPGQLIAVGLLAPFTVPRALLHDNEEVNRLFLYHPYADGGPGYLRVQTVEANERGDLRDWGGQISLENGNDFSGLNRTQARLVLDTSTRFGVQFRFDHFTEDLCCRDDHLSLGSAELLYRFAQSDTVQVYAGLGARLVDGGARNRWGFNFTYGANLCPVRPLVLSFSLDAGTAGSAAYFGGRGTVGVLYKGWEVFTGYDYRSIGSVSLDGVLVGLRLWF